MFVIESESKEVLGLLQYLFQSLDTECAYKNDPIWCLSLLADVGTPAQHGKQGKLPLSDFCSHVALNTLGWEMAWRLFSNP